LITRSFINGKSTHAAMTKPRYALLGSGAVSRSLVARIHGLSHELGPVASTSVRVAARIANSLHSGFAVSGPADFDGPPIILVCAPGTGLRYAMARLEEAPLAWDRTTILIVDSNGYSPDFPQFLKRGASIGSLNSVDGLVNSFVMEGSRTALREARRIVKQLRGKPIEVPFNQMEAFDAARTIASSLFTPLVDSCVESLTIAGMDRGRAAEFAEQLFARTLRSYMHAGRRGWSGPVATNDRAAILRQYEALRKVSFLRAEYFRHSAEFAFDLYQTFPELSRYGVKGEASQPLINADECPLDPAEETDASYAGGACPETGRR
jgi:hypothetical protein